MARAHPASAAQIPEGFAVTMTVLTNVEAANCNFLREEGYGELSDLMRSSYIRAHETFEKLSKADLTAVYGPTISEEWRSSMQRAFAEGDPALVRSMHMYLLTLKEKNEEAAEASRKEAVAKSAPVGLVIFGVAVAMLSVVIFAVAVFMGS